MPVDNGTFPCSTDALYQLIQAQLAVASTEIADSKTELTEGLAAAAEGGATVAGSDTMFFRLDRLVSVCLSLCLRSLGLRLARAGSSSFFLEEVDWMSADFSTGIMSNGDNRGAAAAAGATGET